MWSSLSEKIGNVVIQLRRNLVLFCRLVSPILIMNSVKSLIVTNIVRKMNFEVAWGNLEAENFFRRKLLRQTLVFKWNNAIRESFDLFSASIKKCFDWGRILGKYQKVSKYYVHDCVQFFFYVLKNNSNW